MESETAVASRSRKINVIAVVDTARIRHACTPSLDVHDPAVVNPEHLFLAGAGLSGRAGELMLEARVGDRVAMTATSATRNADDAVIVYDVRPAAHAHVLRSFSRRCVTRERAVQPDPDSLSRDGLPAVETSARFSSFESSIHAYGDARFHIDFAIYALSPDGQHQRLFSYCRCMMKIAVNESTGVVAE
jgi:nematocidal protein AidA